MDKYFKWKQLLSDEEKRNEWIEFYRNADPMLSAVLDFCDCQSDVSKKSMLELAIIAILDEKIKMLSNRHKMAHYMTRPLPRKTEVGQHEYPEDVVDDFRRS